MKFEVKNRYTGVIQFTAEIDSSKDTDFSIKIGMAVKWAIENCADLSDAELRHANLRGANLSGANLRGVDLSGADLSGANLRSFKHDLWGILIRYKNEVPALVDYIKDGKINGSCYSGECACLMGTFAKIKNLTIKNDEFSIKDSSSPAEQWFMMIKPGDNPENNFASKMALKWIEEFLMFDGHKND